MHYLVFWALLGTYTYFFNPMTEHAIKDFSLHNCTLVCSSFGWGLCLCMFVFGRIHYLLLPCISNINNFLSAFPTLVCQFPRLHSNRLDWERAGLVLQTNVSQALANSSTMSLQPIETGTGMHHWAADLGQWPTSVLQAVYRWPLMEEHNNKSIANACKSFLWGIFIVAFCHSKMSRNTLLRSSGIN